MEVLGTVSWSGWRKVILIGKFVKALGIPDRFIEHGSRDRFLTASGSMPRGLRWRPWRFTSRPRPKPVPERQIEDYRNNGAYRPPADQRNHRTHHQMEREERHGMPPHAPSWPNLSAVRTPPYPREDIWKSCEVIITLGGDGSMLASARSFGRLWCPDTGYQSRQTRFPDRGRPESNRGIARPPQRQ